MQNPGPFYQQQIEHHRLASQRLFRQLGWLSILRFGVFVLGTLGIYLSRSNWKIALIIGIIGVAIFLIALARYTDIKHRRALHKRLVALNENELQILSGKFHHQPEGKSYLNPEHPYSLDIDLFGKGSFFQYINRTSIKEGTDQLVDILLSNDTTTIEQRQKAIKELAAIPQWRQYYEGISRGVKIDYGAQIIITWLKAYKPFLNKGLYGLSIGFSGLSLLFLVLGITQYVPLQLAGYWLLLGLGLTGLYLKRINRVAEYTQKAKETFRQYAFLLEHIEGQSFNSELLKSQQEKMAFHDLKASQLFKQFSRALDALDNRNNLISAIFGNGYLLWDIRQTYHVEQWIVRYADKVDDWFEVVTFFDAFNSLGNFVFNHQEYTFPEIHSGQGMIEVNNLGHPLLPEDKRISSDVTIRQGQFFIITGANMAGKSTFLRTVALHIVMANAGLPVCAKASKYAPFKLITSMRTTDSLTDDSSYFFSELTRLKFIVETISQDPCYFVILDEILKGTNSTDKAIGSKKFVERLVDIKATGLIATHDLSLTTIEEELDAVKNYFFDASIENDELYFDYKFKAGVCKNMNASFLLKKMNII